MHLIRNVFAPVKKIASAAALKQTAATVVVGGLSVTVRSVVGNLWINPNGIAVADHTSIKLTTGQSIDLVVKGSLSLISDSSGADYQVVFWEL